MFEVRNDRLYRDGQPVAWVPSPNTSGARIEPQLIVLHDTAGSNGAGAVAWFADRSSKVSAHLVVDLDGRITQCVELDRVAWHTGKSEWKGRQGCNGFAIGIEFANPGGLKGTPEVAIAEFGKRYAGAIEASDKGHWSKLWMAYTEAQLAAGEGVIAALVAAYPTITDLAGHWEISPGRKEDPTPLMPWARMRAAMGTRPPAHDHHTVADVQFELNALGYPAGKVDGLMGPRTRAALFAFQQQNKLPATGMLDEATDHRMFVDTREPKEMPLGTRAETTAADLRSQGSGTAILAKAGQAGALLGGGLALANGLMDASQTVTGVVQTVDAVETGIHTIERVDAMLPKLEQLIAWAQTPRGLVGLGVCALMFALWLLPKLIEMRRVADARTGANAKG